MLNGEYSKELTEEYKASLYYPPLPGSMKSFLSLGDKIKRRIYLGFAKDYFSDEWTPLCTGTVVYIHPDFRFFSVEFELKGGNIIQSYSMYIDEITVMTEGVYFHTKPLYDRYHMRIEERAYINILLSKNLLSRDEREDETAFLKSLANEIRRLSVIKTETGDGYARFY